MKYFLSSIFVFLFMSYSYGNQINTDIPIPDAVFNPFDKVIVEKILTDLKNDKETGD